MNPITPSLYLNFSDVFYQKLAPTAVAHPTVLYWNQDLAEELAVPPLTPEDRALIFSGKVVAAGAQTLALAYAGHQFGHFNPQLGDGRARLLGELVGRSGVRHEVHLKGSGPTPFSRRGDGLATLDSALREAIVSEAMHGLGIPTTRTLAVIGTGEMVWREREFPGAILTRTARSHIRVGTFEYFAARGDQEALKQLLAIACEQCEIPQAPLQDRALKFYEEVLRRQAQRVAQWLSVGFVHGVMNTDNTTVSGETLDFGPCAFMEAFDPLAVWSSIDHRGRYAYARQPSILQWNLGMLGYCLLPLFADEKPKAEKILEEALTKFEGQFQNQWLKIMGHKMGLIQPEPSDGDLIRGYLDELHQSQTDFTLGFRHLSRYQDSSPSPKSPLSECTDSFFASPKTQQWLVRWRERLRQQSRSSAQTTELMNKTNPALLPRNHWVEKALRQASDHKDFSLFERLTTAVKTPFRENLQNQDFSRPAQPEEKIQETFCGT